MFDAFLRCSAHALPFWGPGAPHGGTRKPPCRFYSVTGRLLSATYRVVGTRRLPRPAVVLPQFREAALEAPVARLVPFLGLLPVLENLVLYNGWLKATRRLWTHSVGSERRNAIQQEDDWRFAG